MKNSFFEKPTEDNIKETGELFCFRDAVIALDGNDVKDVMTGADNAIVLTGRATGSNRLADAIEDAVLHTCSWQKVTTCSQPTRSCFIWSVPNHGRC